MALLTTQVLRVCRFRHLSPLSQDNDNSALLVAQWLCSRVIQKSSPWPAFHIPANPTCSSPWHIDPELPSLPLSQLSVCYLLFKLPNQPPPTNLCAPRSSHRPHCTHVCDGCLHTQCRSQRFCGSVMTSNTSKAGLTPVPPPFFLICSSTSVLPLWLPPSLLFLVLLQRSVLAIPSSLRC